MSDSTKLSEAVRSGVATAMPDLRYEGQDSVIIPTKHWETLKNAGIELLKLLPDEDGNHNPELVERLVGAAVCPPWKVVAILDAITGRTE